MTKTGKEFSTEVINESDNDYLLKEGNAGVYSILKQLEKRRGRFTIRYNPNATYREYWVGTDKAEVETVFSSDDCMDYDCITIRNGPRVSGKAVIDKRPRYTYETVVSNTTSSPFTLKRRNDASEEVASAEVLATLDPMVGRYSIRHDGKTIGTAVYSLHIIRSSGPALQLEFSSSDLVKNESYQITGAAQAGEARLESVSRERGSSWWSRFKTHLQLR